MVTSRVYVDIKRYRTFRAVLLIVLRMVAFWLSVHFLTLSIGDDPIILQNKPLTGDWSVSTSRVVARKSWPRTTLITTLSFMVDYALGELKLAGYHVTNIILHRDQQCSCLPADHRN